MAFLKNRELTKIDNRTLKCTNKIALAHSYRNYHGIEDIYLELNFTPCIQVSSG